MVGLWYELVELMVVLSMNVLMENVRANAEVLCGTMIRIIKLLQVGQFTLQPSV